MTSLTGRWNSFIVSIPYFLCYYTTRQPRDGGFGYLRTNPIPAAKAAGHEAVRAQVGVVSLHVAEGQVQPAPVSAWGVRVLALELLVIVDVLGLDGEVYQERRETNDV